MFKINLFISKISVKYNQDRCHLAFRLFKLYIKLHVYFILNNHTQKSCLYAQIMFFKNYNISLLNIQRAETNIFYAGEIIL